MRGSMHCGGHLGSYFGHELGRGSDLFAIVLRGLLPEISERNQDLVGCAALCETMHQMKVFLHPPTHEILPFARDPCEVFLGLNSVGHGSPQER